jgi:hypothetical protein
MAKAATTPSTTKGTTSGADLIDAFANAGEGALEELDRRIVELTKELDTLRVVRQAVHIRIHGNPKRLPKTKKKETTASSGSATPADSHSPDGRSKGQITEHHREQIFQLLANQGPLKPAEIADRLNIPPGSMHHLLAHEWFSKVPKGYTIARSGGLLSGS